MPDPLAGQRERINSGQAHRLTWPDRGRGCPVSRGNLFELRTCHIEITHVRRVRHGADWSWEAGFARFPKGADRIYLLTRGAGDGHGYTHDERQAIATGELGNLGPVLEPEAVPPDQVECLPSTVAATARFESQRREDQLRRLRRSFLEQLREAIRDAGELELERFRQSLHELKSAAG